MISPTASVATGSALALERSQQPPEQVRQLLALLCREVGEQRPLVAQQVGERARREPVDPVRHGAARDERLGDELAGAQLVGVSGATQCGEDVELPAVQAVVREGGATGQVEAAREPRDAGQHLEGPDVQVGSLTPPRGDDTVDIVSGHGPTLLLVKFLDVKVAVVLGPLDVVAGPASSPTATRSHPAPEAPARP